MQPNTTPQQPAPTPVEPTPAQAAPQPQVQPQSVVHPTIPSVPPVDESRKIRNAGRSAFLVGLLMTIIGVLGVVISLVQNKGLGQTLLTAVLTILFVVIMVMGIRLKKSAKPFTDASLIMALAFLYVVLAFAIAFTVGSSPGLGALIAAVLAVYLAVARRKIHNK